MQEVLIIRNNTVPSLFDVVLADFEGENSKHLCGYLTFEQAVDIREEYHHLYAATAEA